MKKNQIEVIENVVGKVVVRSGIFLGSMVLTMMALDKIEEMHLKSENKQTNVK